jgi:hypothetical protein
VEKPDITHLFRADLLKLGLSEEAVDELMAFTEAEADRIREAQAERAAEE